VHIGRSLRRAATNKNHRLVCRQPKPNLVNPHADGRSRDFQSGQPQTMRRTLWLRKPRRRKKAKQRRKRRSKLSFGRGSALSSSPGEFLGKQCHDKLIVESQMNSKTSPINTLSKKEVKAVMESLDPWVKELKKNGASCRGLCKICRHQKVPPRKSALASSVHERANCCSRLSRTEDCEARPV